MTTSDQRGLAVLTELAVRQQDASRPRELPVTPGRHRQLAPRTSRLYITIVGIWAVLCGGLVRASLPIIDAALRRSTPLGVAVTITVVFIAYFWLNGVKDLTYPLAWRMTGYRQAVPPRVRHQRLPLVGLLYVTCNDFSPESLAASLRQAYPRCRPVILDDSSKPDCRQQVDAFGEQYGVPVIRRPDNAGFKAGNLNHYLRVAGSDLDFFVIIDADEIIPAGFVTRALDYFAASPGVGIVQASHVATRNRTTFMRTFAPGVDAHWPAYQALKSRAGFMSLLGHGAMVSMPAYRAAGGFPHVVAEDIAFAIDARRGGFRTQFAADIVCEEEFPPDYAAFKKRHRKWTEGNMEFIRRYTGRILFSRQLTWYEKLDIVLFTYSLPLTAVFSLYVLANVIAFPLLHFSMRWPLWMLIPTVAFLFAPMLNDALTWARAPRARLASYLLHSMALFGSVYFTSLFASLKSMFGSSVFHVTPKTAAATGLGGALRVNRAELIAAAVLAAGTGLVTGSVLPVLLILVPVVFGLYLAVMNSGDGKVPPPAHGRHILAEGRKADV